MHSDPFHHRSVLTLAGEPATLEECSLALARRAVELVDISSHEGVHPRLGAVDVVPFVPYRGDFATALSARDRFALSLSADGIPCFRYGPERSLPDVRRHAWRSLSPDVGPSRPHPTAGACCVGAREVLVAYNLVVEAPLETARRVAKALRSPTVRALGLPLGEEVQVSCNLISPRQTGPAALYDQVSSLVPIRRAELVGLIPKWVLDAVDEERLEQLDLSPERTIEWRLSRLGAGLS